MREMTRYCGPSLNSISATRPIHWPVGVRILQPSKSPSMSVDEPCISSHSLVSSGECAWQSSSLPAQEHNLSHDLAAATSGQIPVPLVPQCDAQSDLAIIDSLGYASG